MRNRIVHDSSYLLQLAEIYTPQPYEICNICRGEYVIKYNVGVFISAFESPG